VIDMEENRASRTISAWHSRATGTRIAYIHNEHLWVRDLSKMDGVELPGTEGADVPAWSPDGREIAYRVGSTYHRISADGGNPTVISATQNSFSGGSSTWWTEDGRILYTTGSTCIMQVRALGGDPVELFPLPSDASDIHEPSELPGGRGIVFVPHLKTGGPCEIRLWAGGKFTTLLKNADQRLWGPKYSSTGHILYRRSPNNTGIWALPFSLSTLEATGEPFLVALEAAEPCPGPGGLLVFHTGAEQPAVSLAILSRDGTFESKVSDNYEVVGGPALSPDAKRLAAVISEKNNGDIWVFDIARGTRTRLTFAPGWDIFPSWSPDGTLIYYTVSSLGVIMATAADGSGNAHVVHDGYAGSISPDGKWMAFEQEAKETRSDIWAVPLPADTTTRAIPIVQTPAQEHYAAISPDGRYVAYTSNESGTEEVYLTRFPEPGGKWQVSTQGGSRPHWDRARGVLYYISPAAIMEVEVATSPAIQLGRPRELVNVAKSHLIMGRVPSYEFFPGGKRFVGSYTGDIVQKLRLQIAVVENWPAEFKTTQTAKK
jgi:Tol biopolymer transport system component